jgi:hypothetical protein
VAVDVRAIRGKIATWKPAVYFLYIFTLMKKLMNSYFVILLFNEAVNIHNIYVYSQ